ncbi:MAG: hypothetical protein JWO82_961, partial [Akkermansiaceae bacterium]|nr:hypothetical protein [Akkermansiaceae bacterium]
SLFIAFQKKHVPAGRGRDKIPADFSAPFYLSQTEKAREVTEVQPMFPYLQKFRRSPTATATAPRPRPQPAVRCLPGPPPDLLEIFCDCLSRRLPGATCLPRRHASKDLRLSQHPGLWSDEIQYNEHTAKKMNVRIITTAAVALTSALALNSCVIALKAEAPSKGKELTELKEALQSKAITPSEYQTQKARILAGTDSSH